MPAKVISFSSKNTLPQTVYCDTTYIIRLIAHRSNPADSWCIACKDFYDKLKKNNVELKTSILAIDESIYFLVFNNCIKKELKVINETRKKNGQKEYRDKDFIKQEPNQYSKIYCKCFKEVPKFLSYLSVLGVKVVYPEDSNLENGINEKIKADAVEIMRKYLLAPADALHIAISLNCGINDIVTNDHDFHRVDGINVYTHFSPSQISLASCSP